MKSSTSDKEDKPGAFLEGLWAEDIIKSYKEYKEVVDSLIAAQIDAAVWDNTSDITGTAKEMLEQIILGLRGTTPETAMEYYERVKEME